MNSAKHYFFDYLGISSTLYPTPGTIEINYDVYWEFFDYILKMSPDFYIEYNIGGEEENLFRLRRDLEETVVKYKRKLANCQSEFELGVLKTTIQKFEQQLKELEFKIRAQTDVQVRQKRRMKVLREIFIFYCKQHITKGVSKSTEQINERKNIDSFDNLGNNVTHMSVGDWMCFARDFGIKDKSKLDVKTLTDHFKKMVISGLVLASQIYLPRANLYNLIHEGEPRLISNQGKDLINFDEFLILLEQIAEDLAVNVPFLKTREQKLESLYEFLDLMDPKIHRRLKKLAPAFQGTGPVVGPTPKEKEDAEAQKLFRERQERKLAKMLREKRDKEMVANQIETLHILAQTKIEHLVEDNVEPAFKEIQPINPKKEMPEKTDKKVAEWQKMKLDIVNYHKTAVELINSIGQNWMIFNGAIYIWNNYLMTFKNPLNDEKLLPEIVTLLTAYFEAMRNSIKDIEKKMVADYDIDSKIQVYGNMGIILARLLEGQGRFEEVLKVSETLLLAPLSPHTRKLVNSIKARVSGLAKGGAKAAQGATAKGPAGQGAGASGQNNNDQILFKVVNQLEIIQNNTNKAQTPALIKECFDSLTSWKARENDETDLELHAELWTKLSKLALNDQSVQMYKYALRGIENALGILSDDIDLASIPTNRLRWYSLAEYLYAETLCRMVNPDTQEVESQETIYLHALNHVLQAANKGSKAKNAQLVVDAAKKFWDITAKLKGAYANRKILLKPIFSLLYYLKVVKEDGFNEDFVLLLLNVLNQGCMENEEWALGETAADMCLELVPSEFKKHIWNWKMVFMSKQGKDEMSIMNNIKECDPFLQSKVWLKLARTATQPAKQYTAFSNAIEVLKKEESVGIVAILIEFSEWLLRNKYDVAIVRENLLMSCDILLEIEEANEEESAPVDNNSEDSAVLERQTVFSRSSRGKKSVMSRFTDRDPTGRRRDATGAPSVSAMSRAAKKGQGEARVGKGAKREGKTMNSESQKILGSQNDEENFDGRLNVKHLDQLMRIHVMLSLTSESAEAAIQYSLDAKFFMLKILEMSFSSLNNLREIAEMALKDEEKKTQTAADRKNFTLPTSQEEWINFEFPQELLSKISTNFESNMFCKYVFDFPELTHYYLVRLLTDLEKFGLQVHCIPVLKFAILLADKVIQNRFLAISLQLRFARCISALGYTSEAKDLVAKVLPQTLISPQEYQTKFIELTRMRPGGNQVVNPQAQASTQNESRVVTNFLPHEGWLVVALELINFGQFVRARSLLVEAKRHAEYLSNLEQLGEIDLALSLIQESEGLYSEALRSQMSAHRIIKSPYKWEESIMATFKILLELEKFTDAADFLNKLIQTFNECLKNKELADSHLKQGWCLCSAHLCRVELLLRNLMKFGFTKQEFKDLTFSLKEFARLSHKYGANLNHNLQVIKLLDLCEAELSCRPIGDEAQFREAYRILTTFIRVGHKMDSLVKSNLKYIYTPDLETKIRSPLTTYHCRLKLALARLYIVFGDLRSKAAGLRINLGKVEAVETDQEGLEKDEIATAGEGDWELREREAMKDLPEKHVIYLLKLAKEVEKLGNQGKKRLDSFERAVALAREVQNTAFLPEDSGAARIECFRGLRRKNKKIGNLEPPGAEVEPEEEVTNEEMINYLRDLMEELRTIKEILNQNNEALCGGLLDYCRNPKVFSILKRTNFEELEIWAGGHGNAEESLLALFKFQDYHTLDFLSQIVDQHARKTSRPRLLKNCIQKIFEEQNYIDQAIWDELRNNQRLVSYFNSRIDPQEMIEKLGANSGAICIQFSEDLSILYVGFVKKFAADSDKAPVYDCRKFRLLEANTLLLSAMVTRLNTAIVNFYKTPILTQDDMKSMQAECQKETNAVKKDLEGFMSPFIQHLDAFVNKEPQSEVTPEEPVTTTNKAVAGKLGAQAAQLPKKPDPKAAQAGKKDAGVGLPQEQLVASKGGLESLVLLIDNRFLFLPFEQLDLVSEVPIVSKDYSLQTYTKRLTLLTADGGSEAVSLKKTHFIAYDFKDLSESVDAQAGGSSKQDSMPKELVLTAGGNLAAPIQFSSVVSGVKDQFNVGLQGVNSNQRVPSIGNWQLSLREADTLIYFGSKPFLHQLSPMTLLDLANSCKVKQFWINDRLNPLKKFIKKHTSVDENSDAASIPVKDIPKLTYALLTLLGASTILQNRGSILPEYNSELMYGLFTGMLGDQKMSLGSALGSARKGRKLIPAMAKNGTKLMIGPLAAAKKEETAGREGQPPAGAPKDASGPGKKPAGAPTPANAQNLGLASKKGIEDAGGSAEQFEAYPEIYKEHFGIIGFGGIRFLPDAK